MKSQGTKRADIPPLLDAFKAQLLSRSSKDGVNPNGVAAAAKPTQVTVSCFSFDFSQCSRITPSYAMQAKKTIFGIGKNFGLSNFSSMAISSKKPEEKK